MNKIARGQAQTFLGTMLCLVLLVAATGCGRSAEGGTYAGVMQPAIVEALAQDQVQTRIVMARTAKFKKLERAPVLFDHLKHVEALKEEGCGTCHTPDEKGRVTYEFCVLTPDMNRQALINAYHEKCMECHDGRDKAAKKARSLGCGDCHVERAGYKAVEWYQATFDHFHHIDEMEKGCDTCHHIYDEQQAKLVYKKGEEIACGKCHKDKDEANAESLRKVGHTSCIACHEEKFLAAETKMDPYACGNCHRPEVKPRPLEPKALVVRSYQANPTNLLISYPGTILPPVPFDHEKHEKHEKQGGKDDCSKSCHHFHVRTLVAFDPPFLKTGDACRQCHAQSEVSVSADAMSADKVYHAPEMSHSCVGCHTLKKKEDESAKGPVTCKQCHTGGIAPKPVQVEPTYPPDKGPEIYVIARLSRKYMPVKFQHAMHTKMIEDCTYCHHHGPEKEQPTCATCHGAPLDFTKVTRPRLLSAYHRMCMGCHKSMGIGPVACTKCHEEREGSYIPGRRLQTIKTLNHEVELADMANSL